MLKRLFVFSESFYKKLRMRRISLKKAWRSRNRNIQIGRFTYGDPKIEMWTNKYRLVIGNFCSIAKNVKIIVDGNHRTDWITTYPLGQFVEGVARNQGHPAGKGDMTIGSDVWIGRDALIVPGVQIGDGAVIAAGSVVTRDVRAYEIVGGNPAQHISSRFADDQIEALMNIRWWDWPMDKIKTNSRLLQSSRIDEFIEKFAREESAGR